MKERPILFNGEMVRAILDGRKTQTRRMVKFDQIQDGSPVPEYAWVDGSYRDEKFGCVDCLKVPYTNEITLRHFPQWNAGDQLYVRETFCVSTGDDGSQIPYYKADGMHGDKFRGWKPSIHMPRWASRLTLEITNVRVERLQDISEEDAQAEGVFLNSGAFDCVTNERHICEGHSTAKHAFKHLWNCVYKNWDSNPWVWVVGFRMLPSSATTPPTAPSSSACKSDER